MKKRQAIKLAKRRYSGHLDYNDPQLQKAITVYVRFKRRDPEEGLFYEAYILDDLREFFEKYKSRKRKQLSQDMQLERSNVQFGPIKCVYAKRINVDGQREKGGSE